MSRNVVFTSRQVLPMMMLALVTLTAYGDDMNKLGDYQWKSRLILVQPANESASEIETLRRAQAEIEGRDIVWFVNMGSAVVSNQPTVSDSLAGDVKALLDGLVPNERVLLIGKDGGIKSRESSLNLDAIFNRVDAMPMRRREMRAD